MSKRLFFCFIFSYLSINSIFSQAPSCVSEGFESVATGTTSSIPGWTLAAGDYTTPSTTGYCVFYPTNSTVIPVVTVSTTPYIFSGPVQTPSAVPNSPFSGTKVLYMNSLHLNAAANFERAEYSFSVTASNKFFQYAYYTRAIYNGHSTCCENQYLRIKMVDNGNNDIPCTSYTLGAPTNASLVCSSTATNNMAYGSNCIYTPNWMTVSADLSTYTNTVVKLIVEVGACAYGGHHQEVFVDTRCSPFPVYPSNVNSSVVGNTINICNAPTAFLNMLSTQSHTWVGPMGSFSANSNTSATTPVIGIYTVNISNPTCSTPSTFTFFLNLGISPNTTVSASNSIICNGGSTNLFHNGSAVSTYSWSTGATTSSIIVSPTITTTYSAIATGSTGCVTTKTITITVQNCSSLLEQEHIQTVLNAYPNPNNGHFTIIGSKLIEFQISDISGRMIYKSALDSANNFTNEISGFEKGIYFISGNNFHKKIVVSD